MRRAYSAAPPSIDVFSEEYIPFEDLGAMIPGNPHKNSIHRWARYGRKGVKLRSVLINNKRCSTKQWVNEFFAATTDMTNGHQVPRGQNSKKSPKKPSAKRKAAARKRLSKAGI